MHLLGPSYSLSQISGQDMALVTPYMTLMCLLVKDHQTHW